jgi:hypothetical protein
MGHLYFSKVLKSVEKWRLQGGTLSVLSWSVNIYYTLYTFMVVSINGGTPKWMVYNGKSY